MCDSNNTANKERLFKMAKFSKVQVSQFEVKCQNWLAQRGFKLTDVVSGIDAWTTFRESGCQDIAYSDRSVVDAHIQTAMEQIFPNVVFKDKKVY